MKLSGSKYPTVLVKYICKTDMVLEENILSKDEYGKALEGKKHFHDFKFAK